MIIVASRENMNGSDGFQIPNNSHLPTVVALMGKSELQSTTNFEIVHRGPQGDKNQGQNFHLNDVQLHC